jgi:hypothetical protein
MVWHADCAKLSRSTCKLISDHINLRYVCDVCIGNESAVANIIGDKLSSIKTDYDEQFAKQNAVIESLRDSVTSLLTSHSKDNEERKNVSVQKKREVSFADMVKRQSNGPLMVIKPKDVNQKSDETKKIIKEKINPAEIPVNTIKVVSNGSVLIQCNDRNKIDECKKSLEQQLGDEYEVSLSKQRQPAFKIVGLTELLSPELLITRVKSQNKFLPSDAIFSVTELKKKDNKIFASMRCDPVVFKAIMDNGRLLVGWDSCRVYEHFSVLRCFNCCGYHHTAKECTQAMACPKCAGDHKSMDCTSEKLVCANCVAANKTMNLALCTNHACWSRDCHVYKRKVLSESRKIDYSK